MYKNVFLVTPNLNAGGAQQVILSIANNLSSSVNVTLAVVKLRGELIESVSNKVRIINLGGKANWLFKLIWLIWKDKPNAVLSTLSDINISMLLIQGLLPHNVRIVVRETLMPDSWKNYWAFPRVIETLYRYTHRRAKYVVVLSENMRQRFIGLTGASDQTVFVIPNGVDPARFYSSVSSISAANPPYLIAVGRLSVQKGFSTLIEAFVKIAVKFPQYQLVIVGEGEEREVLETLIEYHGMCERIILTGFINNPLPLIKQASLFILSSYVEGMSNVLIEALCVGTPSLVTVENTSADEIITEEENGFLVSRCDAHLLAEGLQRAIISAPHMDRLNIMKNARKKFSMTTMIDSYRRLLFD